MISIVIIHWKIKPGDDHRRAFLAHWKQRAFQERGSLVGEFLSEPLSADDAGFPCTTLAGDAAYESFFNVGMWSTKEEFSRNVVQHDDAQSPSLHSFEFAERERMVLSPRAWRVGKHPLPEGDDLSKL